MHCNCLERNEKQHDAVNITQVVGNTSINKLDLQICLHRNNVLDEK